MSAARGGDANEASIQPGTPIARPASLSQQARGSPQRVLSVSVGRCAGLFSRIPSDPRESYSQISKRNINMHGNQLQRVAGRLRRAALSLAWVVAGATLGAAAIAAPLAGSVIGNQASATYTDASAVPRISTSNTVQTIVQQVSSFTLVADQSRPAAPGQTVYFPHTLTNTGNGTDTFNLATVDVAGGFGFGAIQIFADVNGDGVPDNATAITSTGALAASGVFQFVVAGTVPGGATSGATDSITITATDVTPAGGTAAPVVNTDGVTVGSNAVLNVTKSLSATSGPSPSASAITITLTYSNTGSTAATAVTITDAIGSGATAGMAYVPGSGLWNGVATTDAAAGDPAGIGYDFGSTVGGRVTAVIASVAPNVTGTLSFRVSVNSGVAPGTASTANTANFSYDPDGAGAAPATAAAPTNTASYTVAQSAAVVANDVGSTTDASAANDIVNVGAVSQGAIVAFDNNVVNNGNGTDTFNITVAPGTFPAGTTFLLFRADGVTPLVDSNGDSIPDTGPVAAGGANARVFVRAVLPSGAVSAVPVSATMTATSVFNPLVSDTVTDTLAAITASTADLRNGAANALGTGAGPEASAVTTQSVNPGASTTFVLKINNTSAVADTYALVASTDNSFASIALPAGWSVSFRADASGGAGDCSATGAVIANSGVVNAGAVATVCAVVTVPAASAAAPAPGVSLFFRALSLATGAGDRKHDAVIVNTVRSLTLTPNNAGQIFPGGTITYSHTLANTGNVSEGAVAGRVTLARTDSLSGWTSVVYWDANNDGLLDPSDPVLTDLSQVTVGAGAGLDAGESTRVFVRLFSPATAVIGEIDLSTVTATVTGAINGAAAPAAVSSQDTTSVIAGTVRLLKEQVLDANCDGIEATYSQAQIGAGAVPGACIKYRITAINEGTSAVSGLVLSDASPSGTTISSTALGCAATVSQGTVSAPANATAGTVSATLGALAPAAQATLTFCVRIDL